MLRHSFTTRLLFSLVPSTWYCKDDATVDSLHEHLASDCVDLFHKGVSVKVHHQKCLATLEHVLNFRDYDLLELFPQQPSSHIGW